MAPFNDQEERALELFRTKLHGIFGQDLEALRVFGSKARGESTADSDLDILVVLKQGGWESKHAVYDVAAEVLLATDVDISPKVFTTAEADHSRVGQSPLWKSIEQDGISIPV